MTNLGWEYTIRDIETGEVGYSTLDWLNDMGKEGWELVELNPQGSIFKRPAGLTVEETVFAYSEWLDMHNLIERKPTDDRTHGDLVEAFFKRLRI